MTETSAEARATSTLASAALRARTWLLDKAAPLWIGALSPEAPLFPERLNAEGKRDAAPHRLFVQARHIYAFCETGRLGWRGPWRERVGDTVNFLLARGRRADGLYIHRFSSDGGLFDERADLYDQAFMLLALATAGRALGRSDLFAAAEALDDALESLWRLPHGGYFEGEFAKCPPFRQNPHMHLLEAFIALHAATGAARWRNRADTIAELARSRFIDPASGAMREYFDAEWNPQPGDAGRIVEPGHCFEWAWLFETLARGGAPPAVSLSDGLTHFARGCGLDPQRGVAINEVWTNGATRNAAARLWPQTERLKIAVARLRRTGAAEEREETLAAFAGLAAYLDMPTPGAWRDKWLPDRSWVEEPSPGSSLYHIACALGELIDLAKSAEDSGTSDGK